MTFTPVGSYQSVKYGFNVYGDTTEVPGGYADIVVYVAVQDGAGGAWTEAGMDEVTQRLFDLLSGTDFLTPPPGGWSVQKNLTTSDHSEGTPTP